eukprot:9483170-Alexandrium_andersonii.AAC.1
MHARTHARAHAHTHTHAHARKHHDAGKLSQAKRLAKPRRSGRKVRAWDRVPGSYKAMSCPGM